MACGPGSGVWNDVPVHADDQVGEGVSADLAVFLRNADDGRPVKIVPSVCGGCGGRVFRVLVDAVEGAAERVCADCGGRGFLADSEEFWEDADPGEACCPCGSEEFEAAVGFSLGEDGSVRWVTIGLRCHKDGALGTYADWKIDYSPTDHLLTMVQGTPSGGEAHAAPPLAEPAPQLGPGPRGRTRRT
ncbi:hypothetical protein [Streptomyces sp. NPDC088785]|uniref:hypothetical protein n=1 Tax=Streptomyces sp. NPDC088785 TaxID=3365897 RepID=UPI003802FED2